MDSIQDPPILTILDVGAVSAYIKELSVPVLIQRGSRSLHAVSPAWICRRISSAHRFQLTVLSVHPDLPLGTIFLKYSLLTDLVQHLFSG